MFFFSSRRRHTRSLRDWSSDVCSSDLRTYAFEPAELTGAIDRLLGDVELRTRLAGIGARIRARDGVAKAAAAIEAVGLAEIGRASCRERVEVWVVAVFHERKIATNIMY